MDKDSGGVKMKIIQIMDNLNTAGGVNSFVYDLCVALKEAGQDVTLIGIIGDESKARSQAMAVREAGIEVYCLCMPGKKQAIATGIPKLRKLVKEIGGSEQTICNLHLKLSVLMGVFATCGLRNVRCVETYHSLYSKYFLQVKVLSPFISMYIPCSESAKDEFMRRFHPKRDKVTVIPNGVNRKVLRKQVADNRNDGSVTAVSVGRFTNQKNLHITAEAFSKIENESFVYKIFGDGDLKSRILKAAGNSEKIKLCGLVSRQTIINELANASIVVIPSLWEGLSIFMLEALALNCPMMISDIPSLREVFEEEPLCGKETWRQCKWGYLVETSNISAYREAINHYLSNQELAVNMRKTIEKYSMLYTIEESARSYIKTYKYCLKQEK